MDDSFRLFGRQRSLHEILGGGIIADVMMWKRRDVTIGILLGSLAVWVVFEISGYSLLSLVSSVLLLSGSIIFLWTKAAEILNRPTPSIPELQLSQEVINNAAVFLRYQINAVLSIFHDIALGKDPKLFYRVAASLWLVSVVGSWTNFLTLGFTSLVILLTIPVLYATYEDKIDRYVMLALLRMLLYERIYEEWFCMVKMWILERQKQL